MAQGEFDFIEICKQQLEEKFSFGKGDQFTQKDLELLSTYIYDNIGVSISLSTLKRLWKNEFKKGPQLATLNALAQILDYDNWQHFKLENKATSLDLQNSNGESKKEKTTKKSLSRGVLVIVLFVVVSASLFYFIPQRNTDIIGVKKATFKVNKTLTKGTPNTVIFNYNVSKVKADSFFIQQSWNKWRREKIDPKKNVFTSIYYESGFHRAKLIANNTVIEQRPIHILSDGWEAHSYYNISDQYFIDFKDVNLIHRGMLHIPDSVLAGKNINTKKRFQTRLSISKVFNVSSNNFTLKARTRLDKHQFNHQCPGVTLLVVTEKHIFSIGLKKKGCETYTFYKLGEIYKNGKVTDLKALGVDVYNWQDIGLTVKDKEASISIDSKPLYTETFKEDFGDIVGITFIYNGKGTIDYVTLFDKKETPVFEDNFEFP